jgi:hypothetical protein
VLQSFNYLSLNTYCQKTVSFLNFSKRNVTEKKDIVIFVSDRSSMANNNRLR